MKILEIKRSKAILLCVLVLVQLISCASSAFRIDRLQDETILLQDVNVIPMDSERLLVSQDVLIENGIIVAMSGTGRIVAPPGAHVIDGRNRYLIPGLADMHVHINHENDLLLFIRHGVTTVQNMWGYEAFKFRMLGFPDQLKLEHQIESKQILGPRIVTAGPILEGAPKAHPFMQEVESKINGIQAVNAQHNKGYDFVKVYDNLSRDVYDAIIAAALSNGIAVKGHVPKTVGIDGVLASGQVSISHLTGYIDPDAAEYLVPETTLDDYAKKTKAAGVWNCPTVVLWQKRVPLSRYDEMARHPGMRHLSWMQRRFLKPSIKAMQADITYEGDDYNQRMAKMNYKVIRALHRAGAKLLAGTDAGNPFVFPGWSLHEELRYFVLAGLTPYQALQTATVYPAHHLGRANQAGIVAVGRQADLVLLEANPLVDIANTEKIAGVVVRSRWYSIDDLEAMVGSI